MLALIDERSREYLVHVSVTTLFIESESSYENRSATILNGNGIHCSIEASAAIARVRHISAFRRSTRIGLNLDADPKIHFHEIAAAIEFLYWIVELLSPLQRLVNGAAITNDQFVIQVAVFSTALVRAIGLWIYQVLLL